MLQNHQSGAEGNSFGRNTAPKIANALGATMIRKGSNEAMFDNKHIVIKCARPRTQSVGVTYQMLPTLDTVFGAFQNDDGVFDVISLGADNYKKHMTATRSKGTAAGKVGIVTKEIFFAEGERIKKIKIETK